MIIKIVFFNNLEQPNINNKLLEDEMKYNKENNNTNFSTNVQTNYDLLFNEIIKNMFLNIQKNISLDSEEEKTNIFNIPSNNNNNNDEDKNKFSNKKRVIFNVIKEKKILKEKIF